MHRACWISLALATASCTLPATSVETGPVAGAPEIRYDPGFPQKLPNGWLMGDVGGVSVDKHNQVWIIQRPSTLRPQDVMAGGDHPTAKCCTAAPPVMVFDSAGKFIKGWGGPATVANWLTSEHSIFVDDQDNVWLVGNGGDDGQLLKFDNDGNLLLRIGRKGPFVAADDTSMLGQPSDIYVDLPAREVYVSDGYRNRRVIVFDSVTGAFKRQWSVNGSKVDPAYAADLPAGKAPLDEAHYGIVHCVTKIAEEIFVCDRSNSRVQVFTPAGGFIREFWFNRGRAADLGGAWDVVPMHGRTDRIVVIDGANSEIGVLDAQTGNVISSLLSKGHYEGEMNWPHQGAMDDQGHLYVAEVGGSYRVQRFRIGGR